MMALELDCLGVEVTGTSQARKQNGKGGRRREVCEGFGLN